MIASTMLRSKRNKSATERAQNFGAENWRESEVMRLIDCKQSLDCLLRLLTKMLSAAAARVRVLAERVNNIINFDY